MAEIGFSKDLNFKEGKIRVSITDDYDLEIYVNGGLARTIHIGKLETPTEEEVYTALREVGIEPDLV